MVQKLWHKKKRRPKRVGPYCRSQFSTLFLLLSDSTRHTFRPITNNQPIRKFLSLAVTWIKVIKNCKILTFKVNLQRLKNRSEITLPQVSRDWAKKPMTYGCWRCQIGTINNLQNAVHCGRFVLILSKNYEDFFAFNRQRCQNFLSWSKILCPTKIYLCLVPVQNFLCQTRRWFFTV